MKTRVVGLGNDLLSDDAVGLEVVRAVRLELGEQSGIEFRESPAGGLRLLDDLLGCERVILVDAIVSSELPVGTVGVWYWHARRGAFVPFRGRASELPANEQRCLARRYHSTHDTDLASALVLARRLGLETPCSVWLVGVTAREVFRFGSGLHPAVAEGRDRAARMLVRALERPQGAHAA